MIRYKKYIRIEGNNNMEKDSNYYRGYWDGENAEYRRHIKEFDDLTVSHEKHIGRLVATIKEKDNTIAELNLTLEKLSKENQILKRMKIPARKDIDIQNVFDFMCTP
jgi:hypothetical protein